MNGFVRTLAASAAATLVASAHAGLVTSGSFDFMQVGAGYIDVQTFGSELVDLVTVSSPPVGSRIFLGGLIPGVENFYSDLDFDAASGSMASFSFRSEIEVSPFVLPEYEWAFAGNRLGFTSDVPVEILLDASLFLNGGGVGFFGVYGDGQAPQIFPFPTDRLTYFVTVGPGTHIITWGVMTAPSGGTGMMDGTVTLNFVPAPGAAALLALAGVAGLGTTRRRRA